MDAENVIPPVDTASGELQEFKEFVVVGNQLLSLPPYLAVAIVIAFLIYKISTKTSGRK